MRWAEIVDGKVKRITVSEDESYGEVWLSEIFGTRWVYAPDEIIVGEGYSYDEESGAFIEEQPFDSWILDENYKWVAPTLMPEDGKDYYWSESTKEWIEVINETT